MNKLNFVVTGFSPLLINNPQCADPLNKYSKLKKPLTSKRVKTDEDYAEIADLDIRSKIYFDNDLGVYIPSSWVLASLNKVSHGIAKVSKASMRGGVFMSEPKIKLKYRGINKVKGAIDIVQNADFRHKMILPQGQVRLAKVFPIFHDWSFESSLEFDESVVSGRDLKLMFERGAQYGGYGDFRPTFGRANVVCDYE